MRVLTSAASARGLPAALLAAVAILLALQVVAGVAGQPNAASDVPFWHFTVAGVDDSGNNFTQVDAITSGCGGAFGLLPHCRDAERPAVAVIRSDEL
jgi:hypothetical protein